MDYAFCSTLTRELHFQARVSTISTWSNAGSNFWRVPVNFLGRSSLPRKSLRIVIECNTQHFWTDYCNKYLSCTFYTASTVQYNNVPNHQNNNHSRSCTGQAGWSVVCSPTGASVIVMECITQPGLSFVPQQARV